MAVVSVVLLLTFLIRARAELGVIHAENEDGTKNEDFCIAYYPLFHALPDYIDRKVPHLLANFSRYDGCSDIYAGKDVAGKTVAISVGNCSLVEKARLVEQHQVHALLIVGLENGSIPAVNSSVDINITVAVIREDHYPKITALGRVVRAWIYLPSSPKMDPNMALFVAIALFCTVVGALWAGVESQEAKKSKKKRRQRQGEAEGEEGEEEDGAGKDSQDSLEISLPLAVVFVFILCGMLLLLYFFYDYLVYVIIGIFCLAGSMGLYSCLLPLWTRLLPCDAKIPMPKCQLEVRALCLALPCLFLAVFWAVERKAKYAWILQDILGIAFSINMIRTVRLPNLKTCTILLCLLFIYDIFFVFVTPLITKNGDSIMVRVATGGEGSTEQLPMVFTVPRFLPGPFAVCGNPHSLLGFGDVLVPGLLIAHNNCFDLKVGTGNRVYFLAATVGYAISLALTFVGLVLMEKGQPALMYIVPITLAFTLIVAFKRGELRYIFTGKECPKKNDDVRSGRCTPPENTPDSTSSIVINEDELRQPLLSTARSTYQQ